MNTLLEIGLSNAIMAALLAIPAAASGLLCRRPALTHALWLLVFFKLLTPPLLPVSIPWPEDAASAEDATSGPANAVMEELPDTAGAQQRRELRTDRLGSGTPALLDTAPNAERVGPRSSTRAEVPFSDSEPRPEPGAGETAASQGIGVWLLVTEILWPAGSLLLFGALAVQVYRFKRLLRHGQPAPPNIQTLAKELATRLGARKCPEVWLVPGAVSPMLWAMGRKAFLIFPTRLLERLTPEQLRTLVAHELAHFRRRDHWVRIVEVLALVLSWWNPVVWWARRELREAEEQCCDAWVVWAHAGQGRAYALALIQTVAFFSQAPSPLPAAASGIGQVTHLRRRLSMIMQGKTPPSLSWLGGLAILGLGLLLPVVPLRAQARAETPKPNTPAREKIEILKQAIKILEDQEEAKPKDPAVDKQRADEIARAQAILDKAAARVKKMHQELQRARAELYQAADRVSKLTGKPVERRWLEAQAQYLLSSVPLGVAIIETPNTANGAAKEPRGRLSITTIERRVGEAQKLRADEARREVLREKGLVGVEAAPPAGEIAPRDPFKNREIIPTPAVPLGGHGVRGLPNPAARGNDLEKKLDVLLKEIELLRREIRGSKASPKTAAPATPAGGR